MPNLIDRVFDLMETDDDNRDNNSARIARLYWNATDENRDVLDTAFIALCGYALTTLLKEMEEP